MTEISIGRKEKGTNKGSDKQYVNVLLLHNTREKEGRNENLKKEGKMRISILISIYIVHFAFL